LRIVVAFTYVTAIVALESVRLHIVTPAIVTLSETHCVPSTCFPPGIVSAPENPDALADAAVSVHLHAAVVVVMTTEAEFPVDMVHELVAAGLNEADGPDAGVVPEKELAVQTMLEPGNVMMSEPVSVPLKAVLAGVNVSAASAGAGISAMTPTTVAITRSGLRRDGIPASRRRRNCSAN
jgi:hypothetical protein